MSPTGSYLLTDAEALDFLRTKCAVCHNDPKNQPAISSWSVGKLGLSDAQWKAFMDKDAEVLAFVRELEVAPTLPRLYQSLVNKKLDKPDSSPSAMPLGGSMPEEQPRVLEWMEDRFPFATHEAKVVFQHDTKASPPPLDFQCEGPMRARAYIRKIVNEAFDREPVADELTLAGSDTAVVDDALRAKVKARFRDEATWGKEFKEKTLAKFASRLGGASEISAASVDDYFTAAARKDLASEFYQLLLRRIDENYMDILLTDSFPVTANTRALYLPPALPGAPTFVNDAAGAPASVTIAPAAPTDFAKPGDCPAPPASPPPATPVAGATPAPEAPPAWGVCKPGDRKTYFASLSFLNSRRSTFLGENNNYGRVGEVITFLTGESIRPATQGTTTGDPRPTPTCFVSIDHRGVVSGTEVAPRGTLAIPTSARSCQGCHFDRYLAAGSMVFRPFMGNGQMLNSAIVDTLKAQTAGFDDKKKALYRAVTTAPKEVRLFNQLTNATNPETWKMNPPGAAAPANITLDDISKMLKIGSAEKACVVDAQGVQQPVNDLADFAKVLMGEKGKTLARGLAWHVPRIVSGLPVTTVELVETFKATWDAENGRLRPLFEAYFTSKTYSCAKSVTGGDK